MRKLKSIAHHRNGVMGESFYVCLFTENKKNLMGVLFPTDNLMTVSVFDVDLLHNGVISFGDNSFRGDEYYHDIKRWVHSFENQRGAK